MAATLEDVLAIVKDVQDDVKVIKKSFNERLEAVEEKAEQVEANTSALKTLQNKAILNEMNSKRLNFIIHGIDDEDDKDYEDRSVSNEIARMFLRDALKMANWDTITFVDCHRLPQKRFEQQKSRTRKGRSVQEPPKRRAMIIKLLTVDDMNDVFDHAKELKAYNALRSADEKVYITRHLPKELVEQKRKYKQVIKNAKDQHHDIKWKMDYVNAEMCLYVNKVKVPRPK